MAGKFQHPPVEGQLFLDESKQAPSYAWKKWFELIPPRLDSPASSGTVPKTAASQGIQGQMASDGNFLYVCIGANSWKRVALSVF